MKLNRHDTETALYTLAFLLALFLRLFRLGAAPLSDMEAGWALQALGLARGQAPILGAQPAYILLTSQLFFVFGETNFLARLLPALSGSLLVCLPYTFRRWLSTSAWLSRAGLVLAFGLAIDPGLVALSRQVGTPIPALAFTLLALASLYERRMVWTGIFAGLALLSGPAFLQGALILGLSWLLYRLFLSATPPPASDPLEGEPSASPAPFGNVRVAIYAFAATLLIAGTLFLRYPGGLSGLADTIPSYLRTWVIPSGIPLLRPSASLLVYQPLALIFGLLTLGRLLFSDWEDPQLRSALLGLSLWTGIAIILPLFYAGRQVGDIAWVIVPLWALAAVELSCSLSPVADRTGRWIAAVLTLLLFVLGVVGWFNLLSIGRYQVSVLIYWAVLIGALLLGFIATLLVAASWSSAAAKTGLAWAVSILLGLQLVSNTWGVAVVRPNAAQELYAVPSVTGQASELHQTLAELSTWSTGLKDQLEVVSLVDSPALQWALRGFPKARSASLLSPAESPAAVITSIDAQLPSLAQNYRGQDFIWQLTPGWGGVFPPNFINWLAFRQAPLSQQSVILWARADIFPGGTIGNSETP